MEASGVRGDRPSSGVHDPNGGFRCSWRHAIVEQPTQGRKWRPRQAEAQGIIMQGGLTERDMCHQVIGYV
jgi:hypothetical protein